MANSTNYSLVLVLSLSLLGCTTPTAGPKNQQTAIEKFGASVKNGTSKMAAAVKPKSAPKTMPQSSPNGQPGPNVFVAVAEMNERTGKLDEAEANYRKALAIDSKHVEALVGYARLEDRRSNFEAATRLYRRAIKAHPKDAAVRNDLGLCYHRRGRLPDATRELKRAVELDGSNKLYRNNLAAVYVEQNQSDLALAELTAAHGTAVGHYNLGYLLVQKGDSRAALAHFQRASQTDRNLVAAQQWVAKLTMPPGVPASQGGATMVAQAPQGAYATPAQATTPPAYVAQRPQSYAPATSSRAPATGPPRSEPMPPTPRY